MFWHLLLALFSPLASLLSGVLRDDLDRQILALRRQVLILYGGGSFRQPDITRQEIIRPETKMDTKQGVPHFLTGATGLIFGRNIGQRPMPWPSAFAA